MIKNHITRRAFSHGIAAAAAAGPFPRLARAQQAYPSRPVRFILPFGAAALPISRRGSPPRSSATSSGSASWSRTSRGPAGLPLHAPCSPSRPTAIPSGSSPTAPRSARPSTRRCRSIRSRNSRPISTIGAFDLVFATNADAELKYAARLHQGRARRSPASSMSGPSRWAARRTWAPSCSRRQAGLNFQIVPYRGTPDVIVALLRNDIQLMVDFYGPMKATLAEKKIRPVATSGPQRSPFLADMPDRRGSALPATT